MGEEPGGANQASGIPSHADRMCPPCRGGTTGAGGRSGGDSSIVVSSGSWSWGSKGRLLTHSTVIGLFFRVSNVAPGYEPLYPHTVVGLERSRWSCWVNSDISTR